MFDGKVETAKLFLGTTMGFLLKQLGYSGRYLALLIILMMIDTITGWLINIKKKTWKSSKARWGMIGKIVELMFIGVLYLLDWTFGTDNLKYIGIFYFCICEFASMIENMAGLNSNIPTELAEVLKKVKFSVGTKIADKVRNFLEKYIKN